MGEGVTSSHPRPWLGSVLVFIALGLGALLHRQGGEGKGGRERAKRGHAVVVVSPCHCPQQGYIVVIKEGREKEGREREGGRGREKEGGRARAKAPRRRHVIAIVLST